MLNLRRVQLSTFSYFLEVTWYLYYAAGADAT